MHLLYFITYRNVHKCKPSHCAVDQQLTLLKIHQHQPQERQGRVLWHVELHAQDLRYWQHSRWLESQKETEEQGRASQSALKWKFLSYSCCCCELLTYRWRIFIWLTTQRLRHYHYTTPHDNSFTSIFFFSIPGWLIRHLKKKRKLRLVQYFF